MPLLQLNHFSLSVGSTQLLDGVDAQLVEGQRVALVGANGCGKSTLLRALSRPDGTDYYVVSTGSVAGTLSPAVRPANAVLLAEQDALQWTQLLGVTVYDEAEFREMTLPEALDMAAAVGGDAAVEDVEAWRRLSVAAHEVLEWRIARYDATPLGQLSPGSAVRAYLAVALHRRDIKLLLLDEPTNHLDLPSILWLQHAIIASGKALIVVSHDAAFLDAVADHVWQIDADQHSITVSGAGYSAFQQARQLAREQQRAAYEAYQEHHKRLTAVADKLRAASSSGERHVTKDHDKLQRDFKRDRAGRSGRKAKAVESRRDKERLVEPVVEHTPLRIVLEPVGADSTSSTIMLGSVVLGYAGEPLPLPPISLRIDFGERVAIVGFNGVGKSTLLRTMMRAIEPLAGEVKVGCTLHLGNLTQEHESLPPDVTPREHLSKLTGIEMFDTGVRLMRYGLTRRQVNCPIGQLNPGARARALLASFSMRKVNALLLDEPTNHLDEEAITEVVATLNDYAGTVIVVSHNRMFLESLRLTRTLRFATDGLTEVESIDEFEDITEEAARAVVAECFA